MSHYILLVEMNECQYGNGNCEGTCVDLPGTYACTCIEGYTLDPENLEDCLGMCDKYFRYLFKEFSSRFFTSDKSPMTFESRTEFSFTVHLTNKF